MLKTYNINLNKYLLFINFYLYNIINLINIVSNERKKEKL